MTTDTTNPLHDSPMTSRANMAQRQAARALGVKHRRSRKPQWTSAQLAEDLGVDSRTCYGLYNAAYRGDFDA